MKMSLKDALTKPLTILITWNGDEVVRKDFAVGETPDVHYEQPPETSGVAQATFITDGVESPAGKVLYWFPDFKGAQMLAEEGENLLKEKKRWQARTKLMEAARLFEKLAPDSSDLADVYQSLWSICAFSRARPENRRRRRLEAIAWYEKEIAIHERTGNLDKLSGDLINIGVLYSRVGDDQTALRRALKGLEITRTLDDSKDPEAIHAWTHCVSRLIRAGRPRAAEKLIAEGLARFPNSVKRAYLLASQAEILKARGEALIAKAETVRAEAEEILPPGSCPL